MESLGRYQITKEIGRGAMGVVYLGHDTVINRPVALKCLHPHLYERELKDLGRLSRNPSSESYERFKQEIQALGRLTHPHIVTIFDAGEDLETRTAYIVMEYVEGISLAQLLKKGETLPDDQIVRIGIQICRALDFGHKNRIIHRDIKPGNILLTADMKNVKVTDFGIARIDDGSQTQADCLLGTPQYISPEQYRRERIDHRSDLFSVGVLLYELLTCQRPFTGENMAAVMHSVLTDRPTFSPRSTCIPKPLQDLVIRALQKEPARRFSSGAEMADALAALERCQTDPEERELTRFSHKEEGSLQPAQPADLRQSRRISAWVRTAALALFGLAILIYGWRLVGSPGRGTVDLSTAPAGAEVFINEESRGKTPLVLDLSAGTYELILKKEGHYPLEATLRVASGERIPLNLKLSEEEKAP